MTHQRLQNKMKFHPNLLFRIFLCPVCHLKVTANFLPGSDAGTSVTHAGLQNEMKFQPNLSLRIFHGGAKPPPKWVMKCPVFWLIFNNFVTFHHFFTKLGNLIWVFVPNNLT